MVELLDLWLAGFVAEKMAGFGLGNNSDLQFILRSGTGTGFSLVAGGGNVLFICPKGSIAKTYQSVGEVLCRLFFYALFNPLFPGRIFP